MSIQTDISNKEVNGERTLFLLAEFQFISVEGLIKIENHLCQKVTIDAKISR